MYNEERLTKKELKQLRREEKMANESQQRLDQSKKKFITVGIILLGMILIGWWWKSAQLPISNDEMNKPIDRILASDWALGNPQALIKIIEYSDLQCPACKAYAGTDERLVATFGDRVGVAFRHFPLREIHKNANLAAQIAEVAGKSGKFWEMKALLFEKQEEWGESIEPLTFFMTYAKTFGLTSDTLEQEIKSKEILSMVEADYLSGLIAKVNATPTYIVNGQKMNNLRGPDDLIARVDLILREATGSASQ